MWWVLCNVCLIKPKDHANRRFYITSCFHVICEICRQDGTVCKKCGKQCSMVQCNSQAPPDVKELFSDITEIRINKLKNALEYQRRHRSSLSTYHKSLEKKYKMAKQIIRTAEQDFKIIHHKYENAKVEIKKRDEALGILKKKLLAYESCYTQGPLNVSTMEYPGKMADCNRSRLNDMTTPRGRPTSSNYSVFITPESSECQTNSTPSVTNATTPFIQNYTSFMTPANNHGSTNYGRTPQSNDHYYQNIM